MFAVPESRDTNALDSDELRAWLEHVQQADTVRFLMVAIAHEEGIPVEDLADWYDLSADEVTDWIEELESGTPVLPIAEREGIDFAALADASGLGVGTIRDWFEALEDRSVEDAADIVARYSERSPGPLMAGRESRIQYLNYDAVQERGWSIDDDDLFEKARGADLGPSDYGRFLVDAGETILAAAEHRGIQWPYACRGGACANCAVIVKEGDVAMPGQTILTDEQVQVMNARLTCVGVPVTEEVKLVMDVQQLDQFQDLRLPSPMSGAEPAV